MLLTTLRTHLEKFLNEYGLLVWSEDCDQQWAFVNANETSGYIKNVKFFSSWASFTSKNSVTWSQLCELSLPSDVADDMFFQFSHLDVVTAFFFWRGRCKASDRPVPVYQVSHHSLANLNVSPVCLKVV